MSTEQLYQRRLTRYVTALRNEKPDMIPIRPFVAEFTAKYAGYTCQDVAHDYTKAFDAAVKTAFDALNASQGKLGEAIYAAGDDFYMEGFTVVRGEAAPALAETGVDANEVPAGALLGAGLVLAGAVAVVVRRRAIAKR